MLTSADFGEVSATLEGLAPKGLTVQLLREMRLPAHKGGLVATYDSQKVQLWNIMKGDCVAGLKEFSSFPGLGNHAQPAPSQPNTVYELWPGVDRPAALALDDAVSRNDPAETIFEHQDKTPPRQGKHLLDLRLPARSLTRFIHAPIIPSFPDAGTIGRPGHAPVLCCTAATQSRHYGKAGAVARKYLGSLQGPRRAGRRGDLAGGSIRGCPEARRQVRGLAGVVAPGVRPDPR